VYEEFEDTKEVIRIRKLKKDRQHKNHNKKDKRTNEDLQNRHIKLGTSLVLTSTSTINVREYRRGNNKWSIQRNWQQDDKNKAKAKYDMLGHHNAQANTINVNKTCC
jgi:hypothetical protein